MRRKTVTSQGRTGQAHPTGQADGLSPLLGFQPQMQKLSSTGSFTESTQWAPRPQNVWAPRTRTEKGRGISVACHGDAGPAASEADFQSRPTGRPPSERGPSVGGVAARTPGALL